MAVVCNVINQSTRVTPRQLAAACAAATTWAARVAQAWNVPAVTVRPAANTIGATHSAIYVLDSLDVQGALGYHDVVAGRPVGKVDAAACARYGLSWTVTLTHELGEIMVDPWCVAAAQYASDSWIAYELCLSGDTLVPLLDGTTVPIRDLAGRDEFWLYSCDENGHVVSGRAHSARVTRPEAEMVDVVLDNGEPIRCTPDHLFMLRDGSYRRADELVAGTSLMPLYRQLKPISQAGTGTYEQVYDPADDSWVYTHRMVAPDCPNGSVRHHVDFNRYNNDPGNLQIVTGAEHQRIHHDDVRARMADGTHYFLSGHSAAHRAESSRRMAEYNRSPEHRAAAVEIGRESMKKLWERPEFREHHSRRGRELVKTFDETKRLSGLRAKYADPEYAAIHSARTRHTNHVRWHENREIINPDCDLCVPSVVNHKVVVVVPAPSEDAWDITVDEHHNFAVDAGVFVHNCDPVEADEFGAIINGVRVSDYLLPAYFAGGAGPYDAFGHLSGAAPTLISGGYASVCVNGNWSQITHGDVPSPRAVASRRHQLRIEESARFSVESGG